MTLPMWLDFVVEAIPAQIYAIVQRHRAGVMMLEYMGWGEAARLIEKGMSAAIGKGTVTYDFARLMKEEGRTDVNEIKCSAFGSEIINNME